MKGEGGRLKKGRSLRVLLIVSCVHVRRVYTLNASLSSPISIFLAPKHLSQSINIFSLIPLPLLSRGLLPMCYYKGCITLLHILPLPLTSLPSPLTSLLISHLWSMMLSSCDFTKVVLFNDPHLSPLPPSFSHLLFSFLL